MYLDMIATLLTLIQVARVTFPRRDMRLPKKADHDPNHNEAPLHAECQCRMDCPESGLDR